MHSGELFWWIATGVLVVAELVTGTFYLLMIALGFAAGALAQLAGASGAVQVALAAIVALAAVILLARSRLGRRTWRRDAPINPDVNLDIGATLTVDAWHDRCARAQYRGAQWDVELAGGESESAHLYEIAAVRGNCLIVVAKKQATHG
jgi:membrane protein implicated in regulation of membrane protease activity